jgi:hypothetical protein
LEDRLALSTAHVIESFPTQLGDLDVGFHLGTSISVDGDWAVSGAGSGGETGAAYVYRKVDDAWIFHTKLVSSDQQQNDAFGSSVAIDGDTIIVGAQASRLNGEQIGAAYIYQFEAGTWVETTKLTASDPHVEGFFGHAVDIDGDTIVVGASPGGSYGHFRYAAAYVFERSAGTWAETAKLSIAPVGNVWLERFADSVAIEGDTIVIGDDEETLGGSAPKSGAAYVYQRSASGWEQTAKLVAPNEESVSSFALNVALDDGTIVVGARVFNHLAREHFAKAYIYEFDAESWSFAQELTVSDQFQDSVYDLALSLDGDFFVLGTQRSRDEQLRKGYLFQRSAMGSWSEVDQFAPLDQVNTHHFGRAFAIQGDDILGGGVHFRSFYDRPGALHFFKIAAQETEVSLVTLKNLRSDLVSLDYAVQGNIPDLQIKVYRSANEEFGADDLGFLVTSKAEAATSGLKNFSFNPGSADESRPFLVAVAITAEPEQSLANNVVAVTQVRALRGIEIFPSLTSGDLSLGENDAFGISVAVDGELGAVAAVDEYNQPGGVYVLKKLNGKWMRDVKLNHPSPIRSGMQVAIHGDTVVVGDPEDAEFGSRSGAVYLYRKENGIWSAPIKLTASDAKASDAFGHCVAIEGDILLVGIHIPNGYGDYLSDKVYVFRRSADGMWLEETILKEAEISWSFGNAIAINNGRIFVASERAHTGETDQYGAVYVYERSGTGWNEMARVIGPEPVYLFGADIAVDVDQLLVAAWAPNGSIEGYVYRRVGNQYELEVKVTGDHRLNNDGYANDQVRRGSIAIDDDLVVLGNREAWPDGTHTGVVYLYERLTPGTWVQHPTIKSLHPPTEDLFGTSVVLSGNDLLVAAPGSNVDAYRSGAVEHFVITAAVAEAQLYSLEHGTARELELKYSVQGDATGFQLTVYRSTDDKFDVGDINHIAHSQNLSLSNSVGQLTFEPAYDPTRPYLIAVATSAAAEYSFETNQIVMLQVPAWSALEQFPTLLSGETRVGEQVVPDYFGQSVAVHGNWAVVGATPNSIYHERPGGAYVYEYVQGKWLQRAKLAPPPMAHGNFGASVGIHGNTIVVAAPGLYYEPDDGGAVFVYTRSGENWTLTQTLLDASPLPDDGFGHAISFDGLSIAVVGRPDYSSPSHYDDSVQVFEQLGGNWTRVANFGGQQFPGNILSSVELTMSNGTIVVGLASYRTVYPYYSITHGAALVYQRVAGVWSATATLIAPDLEDSHLFGSSVATDGDTIVVGASADDASQLILNSGSGYVFELINGVWTFQQKLIASDVHTGGNFGLSAAIQNEFLVLGSYVSQYDNQNSVGAYLFRRGSDGQWLEHARIEQLARQPGDGAGLAVAIDGNHVLIGAPDRDTTFTNAGAVFAYALSEVGRDFAFDNFWQDGLEQATIEFSRLGLTSPAELNVYRSQDPHFDESDLAHLVATHSIAPGVVLGSFAFQPGSYDASRPYLVAVATTSELEHTLANNELAVQQLPPGILGMESVGLWLDTAPAPSNQHVFGSAVAVSGDLAAVGAPYNQPPASNAGYVDIYARIGGTWTWQTRLSAADGAVGDYFGNSIAISGNTIVVGAHRESEGGTAAGAVYVFTGAGATWTQQAKLIGTGTNFFFGYGVDIDGDVVVVGARGISSSSYWTGRALVYERTGATWTLSASFYSPDYYDSNTYFGSTVAISGDQIVVGAKYSNSVGRVFVYERIAGAWKSTKTLSPIDGQPGDTFGLSVDIDDGTIIVGAYQHGLLMSVNNAGAAYVYELLDGGWQLAQKLVSAVPQRLDYFGLHVAIDGDLAAVYSADQNTESTASGSVHLFRRLNDGRWVRELRYRAGDFGQWFNAPAAIDGDALLIGGRRLIGEGEYEQAVHVFKVLLPSAPALPGDYNLDGTVNAGDYTVWRNMVGRLVVPYADGDGNGDGVVDSQDHAVWKAHFGDALASGGVSANDPFINGAIGAAAFYEPAATSEMRIISDPPTQPSLPSLEEEIKSTPAAERVWGIEPMKAAAPAAANRPVKSPKAKRFTIRNQQTAETAVDRALADWERRDAFGHVDRTMLSKVGGIKGDGNQIRDSLAVLLGCGGWHAVAPQIADLGCQSWG